MVPQPSATPQLDPELVRALLQHHHPTQRISNEALVGATELLRSFILETRQQASIEAECQYEAEGAHEEEADDFMMLHSQRGEGDDNVHGVTGGDGEDLNRNKEGEESKVQNDSALTRRSAGEKQRRTVVSVRGHHVAKVAADILLDFS